jgi:tRNA uridine 5-carboxymethylaminomethyl modification enzyme
VQNAEAISSQQGSNCFDLLCKSRNDGDVPRGTILASEAKQIYPYKLCNTEAIRILEAVEIMIKYKGYIERERTLADKMIRLEDVRIPRGFDFDKLISISIEGRQKLKRYQPETIGQASRITGISPADISVMLVYFGR